MILNYVSLFLLAYVIARFILPLPYSPLFKMAIAFVFFIISQKFQIYERIGGAFFAPDLPRPLLLVLEMAYAALVILVFLLFAKDILSLALWLSRFFGTNWRLPFSPAATGIGLAVAAILISGIGVWQSLRVPDVRTVEITLPNLPRQLDGFSIVQLSDLHIGPLLKKDWLQAVVEKTNALKPDTVVLTGDMIDGSADALKREVEPLGRLTARHGVYGVTGNHEYYYKAEMWSPVFEELGVDMLSNEHRILSVGESNLVLVGIPDPTEKRFGGRGPNLSHALEGAPDTVRVLLAHQPRSAPDNQGVDIQLSGHTHGGLMFFLQAIVASFNKGFVNGLYELNVIKLYVNPGTGLWNGFSCRVGVPSEITHIILRAS